MTKKQTYASQSIEWYTPPWLIESARRVMGSIDLDPASSKVAQGVVQAGCFFTKDDDGLTRDWGSASGSSRVYLNPPYKRYVTGHFIDKLWIEVEKGHVSQAVVLTNVNTSSRWFHRMWKCPMCFFYQRIKFVDKDLVPQKDPTRANVAFYIGENHARFYEEFRKYGQIVWPTTQGSIAA